jgi:hypothetical protein
MVWHWLLQCRRLASLHAESYSIAPFFTECYSKTLSWEKAYCLRLNYSGGLKIRNNHGSGSLGTPWQSDWGGRLPQEVVMEQETVCHVSIEKFKLCGALAEKGTVIRGPSFPGEKWVPLPGIAFGIQGLPSGHVCWLLVGSQSSEQKPLITWFP